VPADRPALSPHDLAQRAAHLALEKKARDVLIIDVGEISPVCDYFVVVTGDSDPQVRAIVDHVEQELRAAGERPWHVEGRQARQWVLLDYVDVVVHVFRRDARETYMLERLWGDAPRETVDAGIQSP
jgi:ribosome-associated protein